MSLYKKGKNWYIDYYYPPGRAGKRIREKIGPVKDEARIVLAERMQDIRQGRNPALRQIKPKPFEAMVKEFLQKHAKRCRDYDSFLHNTNVLLRHFEGKMLQAITPKLIEEFVASRLAEGGVSKATINRQRATLHKIFNCAKAWGYYGGDNPVASVKRFPESPGRARFLSGDEAATLIVVAPRHLRPVIVAALHTGGRLTELLRLGWDDVDLERVVLYFDQTNTKSGKQRELPIDPELARVLRERKKVRTIGGDARRFVFTRYGKRMTDIRTAFDVARRRAKLGRDVTFHTLRHTFASWYMINGGDLHRLQEYLGHSDSKLTRRYAHLSPAHMKAGVRFFGAPAAIGGCTVDEIGPTTGSSST